MTKYPRPPFRMCLKSFAEPIVPDLHRVRNFPRSGVVITIDEQRQFEMVCFEKKDGFL